MMSNFEAFSGLTLNFSMVAYVRIEHSTYQFSDESKRGGGSNLPPPSIWYRKKLRSERVNIDRFPVCNKNVLVHRCYSFERLNRNEMYT